jgi:hypothetical protein
MFLLSSSFHPLHLFRGFCRTFPTERQAKRRCSSVVSNSTALTTYRVVKQHNLLFGTLFLPCMCVYLAISLISRSWFNKHYSLKCWIYFESRVMKNSANRNLGLLTTLVNGFTQDTFRANMATMIWRNNTPRAKKDFTAIRVYNVSFISYRIK